jgi:predicted acylesterase/phospholipase RssA
MDERTRVLVASLVGAAIGAVIGYLYLTGSGRRLLEQAEPRMEDFLGEMRKLRSALTKAQAVAAEGWRSLSELAGDRDRSRSNEWGASRQPF